MSNDRSLYHVTREIVYNERITVEAESEEEARMIAQDPHMGADRQPDPVHTERVTEVEEA